jgi:DNA-binding response OmpR family regulator
MHALIIEDDDLIAMTIEELLRKCGFTSSVCEILEGGEDAFR